MLLAVTDMVNNDTWLDYDDELVQRLDRLECACWLRFTQAVRVLAGE